MKLIQAQIIVFLSQVEPIKRKTSTIAAKFDKSYTYTLGLLAIMAEKGWLIPTQSGREKFYTVASEDLVKDAMKLICFYDEEGEDYLDKLNKSVPK